MKALVLGATGAIGKDLVEQLLQDDTFDRVDIFVRREVDYTYQYNAAKTARENGVPMYVLVSSIGANAKSKVFYTKMKGALDDTVQKLDFPACFILQPPSLIRKGSDRFGEKVGIVALKAFNAIGLMRKYTPMSTEAVAAAMIRIAKSGRKGTEVIVSQDILKAEVMRKQSESAGYDQLMIPVINNIPVLILVLVLTIPVAILAMRLAERTLKKPAATLQ